MTETPDDLLAPAAPETEPAAGAEERDAADDEDPGLAAEESLGLLPPD